MLFQALQHVEVDAELQRFLLRPQREIHVELVITMDSGEVESFNAYRVQHNNFRGPYKGGYRLAPDVDMQEMRRQDKQQRALILHHGTYNPCTRNSKSMACAHSPATLTAFTHLCDALQMLLQIGELDDPEDNCLKLIQ
jgi:hypothetical protein